MSGIHKPVLVQAFISELRVEALDERVLRRFAALDELQRHLVLIGPLEPGSKTKRVYDCIRYNFGTTKGGISGEKTHKRRSAKHL